MIPASRRTPRLRLGSPGRAPAALCSCAMKFLVPFLVLVAAASISYSPKAESIGEVDTVFKLLGPDHKIVVDAYDDPKVGGVTCYVSRAKTGGIKGGLGLAEDKSE